MPYYVRAGVLPAKRHTTYRVGDAFIHEEILTTAGFSGPSSLMYRLAAPTRVTRMDAPTSMQRSGTFPYRNHRIRTKSVKPDGSMITGRVTLAFNDDMSYSLVAPNERVSTFYRNGVADELVLITSGTGTLRTQFGDLGYGPLDFLVIPRGVIVQWVPNADDQRSLVIEANSLLAPPIRYRGSSGQFLERAPFHERDLRPPALQDPCDADGDFAIVVKGVGGVGTHWVDRHPFDLVGWEGYLFPYAFSMRDFEPITGRLHQMPDTRQVFEAVGLAVCCASPALMEDHPDAYPAQPHHTNVDYDEIFYRICTEEGATEGGGLGTATFHPRIIPHGPKPGYESSSRRGRSTMFGLMVETAKPLMLTEEAFAIEDPEYHGEWIGDD
ncbi:MAG: homogentisate 1,2-dioxygenase [Ilumatobacteraceae bacterium]